MCDLECRAKARRYVGWLPGFAVDVEAVVVVEVDGIGIARWGAGLATRSGWLRWWRWIGGLRGLWWSSGIRCEIGLRRCGGDRVIGLIGWWLGGIRAGPFATLRMTDCRWGC